jgi:hypothetical protein
VLFSLISILSSNSEILSSTCSSLLEWPSQWICLFVCLTKGTFYFQDLFDYFFLTFLVSLLNSSFIFCVVSFNSYISFFIVSFVSLCCLLKSSLSSFISLSSHTLHFWCLGIS